MNVILRGNALDSSPAGQNDGTYTCFRNVMPDLIGHRHLVKK